MKKSLLIILLFYSLMNPVLTATVEEAVVSEGFRVNENDCNVSERFTSEVKNALMQEYDLTSYSFSNLTSTSCYEYSETKSIHLTFLFKESKDSIEGVQVSASFYNDSIYDYNILFTSLEEEVLGYTLKNKYVTYYVNDTDEEYYVNINAGEDCTSLMNYYTNLTGEKYFNNFDNYCNIVYKTRTSELKNLVSEEVDYIYYLGENITFHFNGYTTGEYNLELLSNNLNCDISTADYYYPEVDLSCYGIYKKDYRIHFSTHTQIEEGTVYLNVYGYEGGKGKISVNSYNEVGESEVLNFVQQVTSEYFNQAYSLTLNKDDYYTSGTARINTLSVNHNALNDLNKTTSVMYTHYTGENISATYSEPYIQVYLPEEVEEAEEVSDEMNIVPPFYYNRYFIIMSDKIYSEVTLSENNETVAVNSLNEFITPYINIGDWSLNMTVSGSYSPIILYEYGVKSADTELTTPSTLSGFSQGVSDEFANEFSEFSELEESQSLLRMVLNFLTNLFK